MSTPSPSHRRPRRHAAGFTLIEVMVVIVILGLLATIVGVNVIDQGDRADIDATKLQISTIDDAAKLYYRQKRKVPETLEDLVPSHLEDLPEDPWGNEYMIEPDPNKPRSAWIIYSWGPDQEDGTDDDIRSDTMNKKDDDN